MAAASTSKTKPGAPALLAAVSESAKQFCVAMGVPAPVPKPTVKTERTHFPLVLDCPIEGIDKFIAGASSHLYSVRLGAPSYIVGNEGGALYGALLAVGYKPLEILSLRSEGLFDPTNLIEGKQILPDKLHIRKNGADHKGHHFRDRVDELLREKTGGDPSSPVTFALMKTAGKRIPLYITVLDTATASIVTLSSITAPQMSVAEAVLASCAVQPYISSVSPCGGGTPFKVTTGTDLHEYISCSTKQSFPYAQAKALFTPAKKMTFDDTMIGIIGSNAPGVSEMHQKILAERAAPVSSPKAVGRTHKC